MLADNPHIHSTFFGHQFHFGLECHPDVDLSNFCVNCIFKGASIGCLHAANDIVSPCKSENTKKLLDASVKESPLYLPFFQKNLQRRIRPLYRQLRDSIIIELKPIKVKQIDIINCDIELPTSLTLQCFINIQKIGVGSITTLIKGIVPEEEEQWRNLRDPALISLEMNSTEFIRQKWQLMEFVRFLILLSHLSLIENKVPRQTLESSEAIKTDRSLEKFLGLHIPTFESGGSSVNLEIDNYPFAYVQLSSTTAEMKNLFSLSAADIRLSLYGDKNWKLKTKEVITSSVNNSDTSSRDSILWLVGPEGTVKFWSSELETDLRESITATLVETDIVLTMRYFLQTINFMLLRIATLPLTPTEITKMRHRLFTNLDSYCNIDISHKDTTKKRIEKCKKIFSIDEMYKSIVDRYDLLSNKQLANYSLCIERQQKLLTLVFGFFGALSALYVIFVDVDKRLEREWFFSIIDGILGATCVTLIIWLIINVIRRATLSTRR